MDKDSWAEALQKGVEMSFEKWLNSDECQKEFRHLLGFDRKAKELAKAAWLASRKFRPTKRAADTAPRCPKCGSPLVKDETRERSYICSNSGACR